MIITISKRVILTQDYPLTLLIVLVSLKSQNLIKKPTCFKNPDNATDTHLILINRQKSFQDSRIIETGLSDFHSFTAAYMLSLKNFSNQQF